VNDDPRKLRTLLERASALASQHDVPSVMVGLIAGTGDLRFPDFVDYLQSSLRVEDGVFRMTRDRIVVHLADVEKSQATEVMERLLARFHDEFPQLTEARFTSHYVEIRPGEGEPTVKDVLPTLFGADPALRASGVGFLLPWPGARGTPRRFPRPGSGPCLGS
jgi:hypothetical protein